LPINNDAFAKPDERAIVQGVLLKLVADIAKLPLWLIALF
jgi:hypothetical protein